MCYKAHWDTWQLSLLVEQKLNRAGGVVPSKLHLPWWSTAEVGFVLNRRRGTVAGWWFAGGVGVFWGGESGTGMGQVWEEDEISGGLLHHILTPVPGLTPDHSGFCQLNSLQRSEYPLTVDWGVTQGSRKNISWDHQTAPTLHWMQWRSCSPAEAA